MIDLLKHLSSLTPEQLATAALQYGAGLVVVLALLWKAGRGLGKGIAWLFRPAPLSPLGAAILKALDAPDASAPDSYCVVAGGVTVKSRDYALCSYYSRLDHVSTGDAKEPNVGDLLCSREAKHVLRKAQATWLRIRAREDADRAAAALARIPAHG